MNGELYGDIYEIHSIDIDWKAFKVKKVPLIPLTGNRESRESRRGMATIEIFAPYMDTIPACYPTYLPRLSK